MALGSIISNISDIYKRCLGYFRSASTTGAVLWVRLSAERGTSYHTKRL